MNPSSVSVRISNLKAMALSPMHYLARIGETEDVETPARRLGKLTHAIVLGGDFVVWDGETRRDKGYKAFAEQHDGEFIVTAPEVERAEEIAAAVRNDPVASQFLPGSHEHLLEWTIDGRVCQAHLDVLNLERGYVTDLKTTSLAAPWFFSRAALRMHYHAQLAWYVDAVERVRGVRPRNAYIIAVETREPFAVTTLILTDRALDEGRKLYRLWWERLRVCEQTNEWPGYAQSCVPLDISEDVELLIDGEGVAA